IRLGFHLIYGDQKFKLQPIAYQILLEPATVIAKSMRQRQVTSYEVVRAYIGRLKSVQSYLNVYVDERFEEALDEARKVDELLDNKDSFSDQYSEERIPFLGVPFAIKESMQFIGFHNSTGIAARENIIATETATFVENMLKSGVILLCNTNIKFSGQNSLYGTTNNPYNLTRIVGGSSGGAGCIVSATGVPFGVGADIGGSIRMSSFINGIFGHKTLPVDAYCVNKLDPEQKLAHRQVVQHFENTYKIHVTPFNRRRYPVSLWSAMMVNGELSSRDFSLAIRDHTAHTNGYLESLKKLFFRSTYVLATIGLAIVEALLMKHNKRFHKVAHKFYEEIQILLGDDGILFFPTFPQSASVHGQLTLVVAQEI
ncbi:unnamed protein product, partial [Rotaria magnacalcarata]